MSGEKDLESKSAAVKDMEIVYAALNDYEENSGLPVMEAPGTEKELQEYLNMNRDILEKMTANTCGDISIRLAQYGFYLQRLINRERARISWAETKLTEVISSSLQQYDKFMKHENKMMLAIKDNEYASNVYKIKNYAQQRVDRLYNLAEHIRNLSGIIKNNRFNKDK